MTKVLVVEDDIGIRKLLVDLLKSNNYQAEAVKNGADALLYLKTYSFDLVILDRNLPDGDGVDVLSEVRDKGKGMPVLMLTARSSIEDKEFGLESGADDYLTKPFQSRELLARVKALLRRPTMYVGNLLKFKDLELDPHGHVVKKGSKLIKLSKYEFALLEFLMRHPNQVFSSDALLDKIWESDSEATDQAVKSCVKRLRRQVDDSGAGSYIETIYGVGYKLHDPESKL